MTEAEFAAIKERWANADDPAMVLIDVALGDILALIRAVEERDAIIHDLMLDQAALARREVDRVLAGLSLWVVEEKNKHSSEHPMDVGAAAALGVVLGHLASLPSIGNRPDPLPPDQVRQENERLRQQIDELLSGCGSHSCKVQRPHGQGVNGPCRCVEKLRAIVEGCEK